MDLSKTFPIDTQVTNYVFLGEAGCGKSEIAVNLALWLHALGKEVHLFDLDMTKPLFRTRDLAAKLEGNGICLHFQEQFADAPTTAGGVRRALTEPYCTILDVGGDYIGARAVGAYAPLLRREDTAVYYVINPFRPWSTTLERLDGVFGQILQACHLSPDVLHLLGNPNLGPATTAQDVIEGAASMEEMLAPYKPVEFLTVEERLIPQLEGKIALPVFPLQRQLPYPWEQEM